jgi:hypothetical protein
LSVETAHVADREPVGQLAAQLVCSTDTSPLSGAELVVGSGWFGLRAHPRAASTISYGGPEIPVWLDDALRGAVAEISY